MGNSVVAEDGVFGQLREAAETFASGLVPWILAGAVFLLAFFIVCAAMARRRRRRPLRAGEPGIDVGALRTEGPPPGPPVLEFYNIPARLAGVILAPAGRVSQIPAEDEDMPAEIFEELAPGLGDIVAVHHPVIRRWPPQVSERGFAHKVFRACNAPMETGESSQWCAVAGGLRMKGRPMMAGLILCTARPVSHPCRVIEDHEEWLDCLRVRTQNV